MGNLKLISDLLGKSINSVKGVGTIIDCTDGDYFALRKNSVVLTADDLAVRLNSNDDEFSIDFDAEKNLIFHKYEDELPIYVSLLDVLFGYSYSAFMITSIDVFLSPHSDLSIQAVRFSTQGGTNLLVRKDSIDGLYISVETNFSGWVQWYTDTDEKLTVKSFALPRSE